MKSDFSRISLGQQIAGFLKEKINKNEYKDGVLPKENDLAEELQVSRGTLRAALAILEKEDLILRVKKRGTLIRGFSMQYPDFKRVKRLNLFYHSNTADFFSTQTRSFYSSVFNAILAEASKRQYILNVGLIETGVNENASLQKCLKLDAEGNILLAITDKQVIQTILNTKRPTILFDHEFDDLVIDTVNVDSYKASYDAIKYLLQKGHRKILYLNHYKKDANVARVKGVKDALRDFNIAPADYYEIACEPVEELSYKLYRKLRSDFPPVTAIAAFDPPMALGFIRGLEADGKRIPEDYSIISNGNVGASSVKLNTIEFDLNELGRVIVESLLEIIKTNTFGEVSAKVPGFLADRGSVADIS